MDRGILSYPPPPPITCPRGLWMAPIRIGFLDINNIFYKVLVPIVDKDFDF